MVYRSFLRDQIGEDYVRTNRKIYWLTTGKSSFDLAMRGSRNSAARNAKAANRELVPHKIPLPKDPPPAQTRPWTGCRLELYRETDTFTNTIQLGDLLTSLRVKYGVSSDTTAYIFKIDSVRIWGSLAKAGVAAFKPMVMSTTFYDPNEAEGYGISVIVDSCSDTSPARTGLQYGTIRRNNVVSLGDVSKKLAVVQVAGADLTQEKLQLAVHVTGQWAYASAA